MAQLGGVFNLVEEPWVAVLDSDGRVRELSLTEVFTRAESLTQLAGEVPSQDFAMLRLLLAILHRATDGPRSMKAWLALQANWGLAADLATAYLERFRSRFDLRDAAEPFLQVATLRTAKDEVSGLQKIIADVPNGAPYLTTRLGRGLSRITWAEAARWLVHVHAFDPSGIRSGAVGDPRVNKGKVYPIGTGWAGELGGVNLVGESLAETLLLNLVVPTVRDLESGPHDAPPWERPQLDQCVDDSHGGEPRGLVDLYTWQSRRVRLVGDDAGVTGVVLAQGDRMTPQDRWRFEPMTAWRYSEPQSKKAGRPTYMPLKHDPDRQFWRGLEGLLARREQAPSGSGPARRIPPELVEWAAILASNGHVPRESFRLRATVVEYGAQNSTFAEIADDEIVLPADVIADETLSRTAVDAVNAAEAGVRVLAQLARNVALAGGASRDDEGPSQTARARAYAELDPLFRSWVARLRRDDDRHERAAQWQREVRAVVHRMSRELVSQAAPAAWVGRTVQGSHLDLGRADAWFHAALVRVLPLAAPKAQESEAKR